MPQDQEPCVESDYEWSAEESEWMTLRTSENHPNHGWNRLVFYEVHPKTTMNPASGVDNLGTYRGFGELAPYLQDLGVNAVELLPILETIWMVDTGVTTTSISLAQKIPFRLSFFRRAVSMMSSTNSNGWSIQLHQHDITPLSMWFTITPAKGLWRERLYFESYDAAYD